LPHETGGAALELWGGHESTINRVGDIWTDQSQLSGHDRRTDDLDRFAGLGIARLRYPLLWEKTVETPQSEYEAHDRRLDRLRALGVAPIVGLIHHGSGPADTSLLSEDFARGLAAHARRTAERYPWIDDWTPVNEPLTTARFSALYGHWYPHVRDERAMWVALLNQIDATRLAMRAIRTVNPGARLIQTEDLGRTYATAPLQHRAAFDNVRRWATWDLLCGVVADDHPLVPHLASFGLSGRLEHIAAAPCPPDIIGINHYLTSDRFLDHDTGRYPDRYAGGPCSARFADVEAVRVARPTPDGLARALRETWQRYRRPIALTEVHNGCTREEQLRWLADAWQQAGTVQAEGVDIRAVTAWSLLGAYDWDSLLTEQHGRYECGVFDVRSDPPRPTAAVDLLRDLAAGRSPSHPVLARPGWWRRDSRLLYRSRPIGLCHPVEAPRAATHPVLITGATGTLGRAFAAACADRDIPYILTDRTLLSLTDPVSIERALAEIQPWAVINTAGWVRVDDAESNPIGCLAVNRDGNIALGIACADRAIPYVTFSSDLVFDGNQEVAYCEGARVAPLNVYGRSKAEGDRALLDIGGSILVLRTAAFFSHADPHNFAVAAIRSLRDKTIFRAVDDCSISPTYVPDLVRAALDLLIDRTTGLWHLVNDGGLTWAEFAGQLARASGLDFGLVEPVPQAQMAWTAPRPVRSIMSSDRGMIMPELESAVRRFASEIAA
jgi:dTDP-4-dehydrorhamnose reductase